MRTVRWSDTAIDQFDAAIAYLAERNPTAADTLADRLEETIDGLAKRPIGRPGHLEGTYEKAVLRTAYLTVYSLTGGPDGDIHIHRVFHTSQNWTSWWTEPDVEVQ